MDKNFRVLRAETFICRTAPTFFLILVKEDERWGIEPTIENKNYSRKYFDTFEAAEIAFNALTIGLIELSDGYDKKEGEHYFEDLLKVIEFFGNNL